MARILEAANKLFATRGFHGTSIASIAKESKMTSGALYWHFKSKGDLLLALIRKYDTEFLDRLFATVGSTSGNALDKFHRLVSFSASFVEENRYLQLLITVMSAELHGRPTEFDDEFKRLVKKYAQFVMHLIEVGKSEGIFDTDLDTHHTAYTVFALNEGMLLSWQRNLDILNGAEYVRSWRRLLVNGLIPKHPQVTQSIDDHASMEITIPHKQG